jgi:hypothetical protein
LAVSDDGILAGGSLLFCAFSFLAPLGRDETIHRIRVSAHSGIRRPLCRPPPLDAPQLLRCSTWPKAHTSVRHTIAPRKRRATSRYFRGHPHARRTPASLSESVPHNESAQATLPPWALAVPETAIISITVVRPWYYFYICPAAPQPDPA